MYAVRRVHLFLWPKHHLVKRKKKAIVETARLHAKMCAYIFLFLCVKHTTCARSKIELSRNADQILVGMM